MHTCDQPHCCNPLHLVGGTHLENMQDKELKGRGNHGPTYKLNEDQIKSILSDTRDRVRVGLDHGISVAQVSYLRSRRKSQ